MLTTLLRLRRVKRAQVGGRKQLIAVFSPTAAGRVPGFCQYFGNRRAGPRQCNPGRRSCY